MNTDTDSVWVTCLKSCTILSRSASCCLTAASSVRFCVLICSTVACHSPGHIVCGLGQCVRTEPRNTPAPTFRLHMRVHFVQFESDLSVHELGCHGAVIGLHALCCMLKQFVLL